MQNYGKRAPATIEIIAAQAGVSRQTVSAILGANAGLYRPETCKRVREVAARVGYRKNTSARALRLNRFGSVGLILSEDEGRSWMRIAILDSLQQALHARDLNLQFARLPNATLASEFRMPRILTELSIDGLILNILSEIPESLLDMIHAHRIPAVWFNRKASHDSIYMDSFAGAGDATRHLLALGHRRIAYLDTSWDERGGEPHFHLPDRLRGYEAAMIDAGQSPRRIVRDGVGEALAASVADVLRGADRPTAVVVTESSLALGLFRAALQVDLVVPRDLSIITFDYYAQMARAFPMTLMTVNEAARAEQTADLLVRKIESPHLELDSRRLTFKLGEPVTCAPAPGAAGA